MEIALTIRKQIMTAQCDGPIVAGSAGQVFCRLILDDGWEGMLIRVVFSGPGGVKEHVVTDVHEIFEMPWEPIRNAGSLMISAIGEGPSVLRPTALLMYPLKVIRQGHTDVPEPEGSPRSLVFQAREAAVEAQKSAEAAEKAAEDMNQAVKDRLAEVNSAESERVKNEQARGNAEITRETSEALRLEQEQQRVDAEEERKKHEAARMAAEEIRLTAEAGRVKSEAEREQSEESRASNESRRVDSENQRGEREDHRIQAENRRTENEQGRQEAEQGRALAEAERERLINEFFEVRYAPPVARLNEAVVAQSPTLAMIGG